MANLEAIVQQLKQHRDRLDAAIRALTSLDEAGGTSRQSGAPKRRTLSAAARRKIAAAQRARWQKSKPSRSSQDCRMRVGARCCYLALLLSDHKRYRSFTVRFDVDLQLPYAGRSEDGAIYSALREYIERAFLACHGPAFVPSHKRVIACRNIRQLELSILIANCIIGMRNYE